MKSLWRVGLGVFLAVSMIIGPAAAKVKLVYWQGWLAAEHIDVEKEIVDNFMKQNPDIEVEFSHMTNPGQQLKVALAAGVLPDIMVSSRDDFPEWAGLGRDFAVRKSVLPLFDVQV